MQDTYIADLHVGFPLQLQIKWDGTYYDIVHFMDESEAKEPCCYSPENPDGGHSLTDRLQDETHPVSGKRGRDDVRDTLRAAIADYMILRRIDVVKAAEPNVFSINTTATHNILDMSFFYGDIVQNGPSAPAMRIINRVLALAKPDPIEFEAGPLSCRLTPMTDEPHFWATSTLP